MASLTFTHFLLLPRNQLNLPFHPSLNLVQLRGLRLHNKWLIKAVSRKQAADGSSQDGSSEIEAVAKKKTLKASKQATTRTRKKAISDISDENEALGSSDVETVDDKKKTPRRTRRKATTTISATEEGQSEKKVRKRKTTKKKNDSVDDQGSGSDLSNAELAFTAAKEEDQNEKKVRKRRTTKKKNDSADGQVSESDLNGVMSTFIVAKEEGQSEKVGRRMTKKKYDSEDDQGSESDLGDVESAFIVAKEEDQSEKKGGRPRTIKKKYDSVDDQDLESDVSDVEYTFIANVDEESEDELDLRTDEEEDISSSYYWPPLVCCFGSAQHPFVPSGRPADRRVDYKSYEKLRDAVWIPENFVRAPGGSAANVAIALARLGGKVAFMGKLGDDAYGWDMVNNMNGHNVQTRSVCLDGKRKTAATQMKIHKRGKVKVRSLKPCAEDSLMKSEINIDVLKEAKMFYVSTHSLLDTNMQSTALRAIKIAKKLGGLIFYDVNIPLPLWRSDQETKAFIQEVWNLADFIEITNQELEFIYGIKPSEELVTNNKLKYRFAHYDRDVIASLCHENLKVLFMTNGTSIIHYYTSEHYGAVRGSEDPPITAYTCDMSASGDGIVAGLMHMLTIAPEPHLITDNEYLKETVQYAIDSGIHEQWILFQKLRYPPKEGTVVAPDENGIRSITEQEYRTFWPATVS